MATRPAVAVGAEDLGGVEGEGGKVAEAPRRAPALPGAVALGAVLQHAQAVAAGEVPQRRHVRALAEEVHGQQAAGARRHRHLRGGGVHQVGAGLDVREDRHRPGADDGGHGRHRRVGDGDHLVARADVQGLQRQEEGVGTVGHPDPVCALDAGGERLLEVAHLLAQDQPTGLQHLADSS